MLYKLFVFNVCSKILSMIEVLQNYGSKKHNNSSLSFEMLLCSKLKLVLGQCTL
jgi:hypothetical protein